MLLVSLRHCSFPKDGLGALWQGSVRLVLMDVLEHRAGIDGAELLVLTACWVVAKRILY